jgi:hypothetical protein
MGREAPTVTIYDTYNEPFARPKRAGWSVGDVRVLTAARPVWLVTGANGDVDQPYCLLRQDWLGLRSRRLSPETQAGLSVIVYSAATFATPSAFNPTRDLVYYLLLGFTPKPFFGSKRLSGFAVAKMRWIAFEAGDNTCAERSISRRARG